MRFTSKWIYSIRAIFDLVHHSNGKPVSLTAISERQNISLPFLAQIFHKLRKGGIVKSVRGVKGGFVMARDCKDIHIGEILRIVEDSDLGSSRKRRGKGSLQKVKMDECISHLMWKRLGKQIFELLDNTSIKDLLEETKCPEICAFTTSKNKSKR